MTNAAVKTEIAFVLYRKFCLLWMLGLLYYHIYGSYVVVLVVQDSHLQTLRVDACLVLFPEWPHCSAQAFVALWLYWPYESRSFLKDDWDEDWFALVEVSEWKHWFNIASAFSIASDEEKAVLERRDMGYWFLLASAACCPFLLLLAYIICET